MLIYSDKAFFNWLKTNSKDHWNFTDVKSVHDWIIHDNKLKNVQSIGSLINLMEKDSYFNERHIRKVHSAYEYYCKRVIDGLATW